MSRIIICVVAERKQKNILGRSFVEISLQSLTFKLETRCFKKLSKKGCINKIEIIKIRGEGKQVDIIKRPQNDRLSTTSSL